MKLFSVLLFLLPGFTLQAQSSFNYQRDFKIILERTSKNKDNFGYNSLLTRFKSSDTTLTNYEVLTLMIGFTAQPAYKPYDDVLAEDAINRLNAGGHYQEAIKRAGVFLRTHPLSISANFEKAYAFGKLQQKDSAAVYAWRGTRILNAMYFSGEGKTPETPIFALGPADGQDFVTRFLGGKTGKLGSGKDKNGNTLDIIETTMKDGKNFSLYFIIQHATQKLFNTKGLEKKGK